MHLPQNLSSLLRHVMHMWVLPRVIKFSLEENLGISFIVFLDHVCIQVMLGSKKHSH